MTAPLTPEVKARMLRTLYGDEPNWTSIPTAPAKTDAQTISELRCELEQVRSHLNNSCGALTDANLSVDVLRVCVTDRDTKISELRDALAAAERNITLLNASRKRLIERIRELECDASCAALSAR